MMESWTSSVVEFGLSVKNKYYTSNKRPRYYIMNLEQNLNLKSDLWTDKERTSMWNYILGIFQSSPDNLQILLEIHLGTV